VQVQDELYRIFLAASGQQAADFTPVTYALSDLIAQLGEVQRSTVTQVAATQSKAPATEKSETAFEKVIKSGFGVSPIISGLIDLFTGSDQPAPLFKYALPPSIAFQAAETRDGLSSADYDQAGVARAYAKTPLPRSPEGENGRGSTSQQITVNVSAMDARSFLDRSGDIALAVREAMLNLNSINDVVNEL
jgi:hypothetical protein